LLPKHSTCVVAYVWTQRNMIKPTQTLERLTSGSFHCHPDAPKKASPQFIWRRTRRSLFLCLTNSFYSTCLPTGALKHTHSPIRASCFGIDFVSLDRWRIYNHSWDIGCPTLLRQPAFPSIEMRAGRKWPARIVCIGMITCLRPGLNRSYALILVPITQ
jgi:hypothetical protein